MRSTSSIVSSILTILWLYFLPLSLATEVMRSTIYPKMQKTRCESGIFFRIQIGFAASMLSFTLVKIQNIELPNNLPLMEIDTAIVLRENCIIVFMIYERISKPLLVPVSLDTAQLLTTLIDEDKECITDLRRRAFIRTTRIKVSVFP